MAELKVVRVAELNSNEHQMRGARNEVAFGELVESIRRSGILQPILVRRDGEGFVVVAGHRRTEAAKIIGLVEVPAYICDLDSAECVSAAYAENIFRDNLSPIEEAAAVRDLVVGGDRDVSKVAAMLGRSEVWVRERMAICDWPGELLEAVHGGLMSLAAARNLAQITDDVHRGMLVGYGCDQGVTARVTMAWYQSWKVGKSVTNPGATVPVGGSTPVAQLPPYTPCIICGVVMQMGQMSYQPVCSGCGVELIHLAKERLAGGGGDRGSGKSG